MKVPFDSRFGSFELDDGVLAPFREELARGVGGVSPVRMVYAAAHVCLTADYAEVEHAPGAPQFEAEVTRHIDWDVTLGLRTRLDDLGFGVAEAMDTAQRFQIGWSNASQLIERTGALDLANGFVAGAGVDHLDGTGSLSDLVEGVVFQARFIQEAGGIPILLPLVRLAQQGSEEEDYVRVYSEIIERLEGPLFVHWLGEMFLPALEGYFPGESFERVMAFDPAKVRGAKLSLLDAELEKRLRSSLLERDQLMLTGDDFHFGDLIAGGPLERTTTLAGREVALGDFSHGLLGIFDGIAEPASVALAFLARGDLARYHALMEPCERLGRHLFQAPTLHYKSGLAFLSWVNGFQPNAMLVQHEERARSPEHYVEAARLASEAGVIVDAEAAATRLRGLVEQSPAG
jgi:hypothetical protein